MFNSDEDEKEFERFKSRSDATSNKVNAIKVLQKRDFTIMMGSGLIVSIQDLTGTHVVEPFMMAAEDMQEVAPLFVKSLLESFKMRKLLVTSELKDICEILEQKV